MSRKKIDVWLTRDADGFLSVSAGRPPKWKDDDWWMTDQDIVCGTDAEGLDANVLEMAAALLPDIPGNRRRCIQAELVIAMSAVKGEHS